MPDEVTEVACSSSVLIPLHSSLCFACQPHNTRATLESLAFVHDTFLSVTLFEIAQKLNWVRFIAQYCSRAFSHLVLMYWDIPKAPCIILIGNWVKNQSWCITSNSDFDDFVIIFFLPNISKKILCVHNMNDMDNKDTKSHARPEM